MLATGDPSLPLRQPVSRKSEYSSRLKLYGLDCPKAQLVERIGLAVAEPAMATDRCRFRPILTTMYAFRMPAVHPVAFSFGLRAAALLQSGGTGTERRKNRSGVKILTPVRTAHSLPSTHPERGSCRAD